MVTDARAARRTRGKWAGRMAYSRCDEGP